MKIAKLSGLVFLPLALCTTLPGTQVDASTDDAVIKNLEAQAGMFAIAGLAEELSTFFKYAQQVGDDALSNYENKDNVQNWPNSMDELIRLMDTKITTAGRSDIIRLSTNPLQDLINGVGNAVNTATGAIGGIANQITSGVPKNMTFGIPGVNVTTTPNSLNTSAPTNPLNNLIGGITGGINNIFSGGSNSSFNGTIKNPLDSLLGGLTGGLANATAKNPIGDLLSGLTGGLSNVTGSNPIGDLLGGITSGLGNSTKGVFDLLSSVTGNATQLLGELTGGIINPDLLKDTFSFLGSSIAGILDGKLDIPTFIKDMIDRFLNFTGGNNPLGKFIQNVANDLSSNPDGPLANIIKINMFVFAIVNTVTSIAKNVFENITNGIKNSIETFVRNVIQKIFFGGFMGLGRLQSMSAEEASMMQEYFLAAVRAQGSPATVSYVEALVNILNKIATKISAADPNVLAVLTDPSEVNIRRFVLATAKAITDNDS